MLRVNSASLGERIRAAREAAGLTQREAAEELGIPHRTWQSWEAGETLPRLGSRYRRLLAWIERHEVEEAVV